MGRDQVICSYINNRLDACADKIHKINLKNKRIRKRQKEQGLPVSSMRELSKEYILACTTDIAD